MSHQALANSVPVPRLDVRIRKSRGKLTVAGPEHVFELEGVILDIWKMIDGSRTIRDIGALISEEYDVPVGEAVDDTAEALMELVEHGLLTLRSDDE
ncbi:PqqD family protein [Streptomyces sp. MUM 178J]|uniref:PqqD family protein n=1 Tax=Streptomyces sp. MUM 178J TaxID=2791991 RepID=UPI001F0443CA|nr:PqqD family protein [Streptomyces sp. MUM 178J]WRQ80753.1 PqqD family protein [Streptomyces sp. MUM 178J]